MTEKEKLKEEATALEIDITDLTVAQLKEAIAAAPTFSGPGDDGPKDTHLAEALFDAVRNLRDFIADNKAELEEQLDVAKVARMAAHMGMVEQVYKGDR